MCNFVLLMWSNYLSGSGIIRKANEVILQQLLMWGWQILLCRAEGSHLRIVLPGFEALNPGLKIWEILNLHVSTRKSENWGVLRLPKSWSSHNFKLLITQTRLLILRSDAPFQTKVKKHKLIFSGTKTQTQIYTYLLRWYD